MSNKWLIIDCNYLCHRAKHSMGGLSYGGTPTGVIFGFFKELEFINENYGPGNLVFCFDSRASKRKRLFEDYKAKRYSKPLDDEELQFEIQFRKQIKKLWSEYLPMIGFANVLMQKGYESDDIMASICATLPYGDEAVIITADHDLYQTLANNVSIYQPGKPKLYTRQRFKKEYGISPVRWAFVKALAGCHSDNVPGIPRVGEKTAIKYIKGELKNSTAAYKAIISKDGKRIVKRNLKLVSLPLKGTKLFRLRRDRFSKQGWETVVKKLGMKSIRTSYPWQARRYHE